MYPYGPYEYGVMTTYGRIWPSWPDPEKRGSKNDPKMGHFWGPNPVIPGPCPYLGMVISLTSRPIFEHAINAENGVFDTLRGQKSCPGPGPETLLDPLFDPPDGYDPMWVLRTHNVPGLTPSIWGHEHPWSDPLRTLKKGSKKGHF